MAWNFGKILSNPGRPCLIRIFGAQKHNNNLVLTQMGVHDILHIIQEIMYGIHISLYPNLIIGFHETCLYQIAITLISLEIQVTNYIKDRPF